MNELRIIGAAFPRTGTMSVKKALKILGIEPCYHMNEVFLHPQHIPLWQAAATGIFPDWKMLLAGYACTLDAPACQFWRELAACFPVAKILLLRRDPERWYASMRATICPVVYSPAGASDPALSLIRQIFFETYFEGRFDEKVYAIDRYRRYCDEVMNTFEAGRVLDYTVSQGWEPLCEFLGYAVPQVEFPHLNTTEQFVTRTRTFTQRMST
jgi:hypothetical protein